MSKQIVAIVGRPNVGKSTLFNRCIGEKHAIVDDLPGVTRDRIYRETDWNGHDLILVDTGGVLMEHGNNSMDGEVLDQVRQALEEADVVVFVVDGKEGLTGADEKVANIVRRVKKPIVLAVNKIDTMRDQNNAAEFYSLGIGEPICLSAMTGSGGVGDLLDAVVSHFPEENKKHAPDNGRRAGREEADEEMEVIDPETCPFSMAVVGRPNVGKSSIINVLCGQKRAIVGDTPGTTRDAVDTKVKFHGREITLVDTAGIRRKNRVDYGVEAFSVVRSLKALDRADVVVLILDASLEISDQDQKIASKIEEAGKACVIVVNKWDLIEDRSSGSMKTYTEEVKQSLRSLNYAEVLFTSALNKLRVQKIVEAAARAFSQSRRRISTGLVNQIINESVALVPPPASKRGKRLRVYYSTQVQSAPPTFILFCSDDKLMSKSYETYLERKIREAFGFQGAPIRLVLRAKAQK
jgi:GTP-binding protein